MEFLPDQETLSFWLTNYGSISLFFLLALGVFALPVPDETLMVLAGIFMEQGNLPIIPTVLSSLLGSMTGITLSYLLGRTAGSQILHRYGKRFGLTEEKLLKTHNWFERYGKWTLTFGYFIPGVRHLTGFAAGSSDLEYPIFAFFAYLGAAIWVIFFLSMGYFVGNYWYQFIEMAERASDFAFFAAFIAAVIAIFFWLKQRSR